MAKRMIEANGATLCSEPFGDRADPAILLVMGIGASMLWWDADFCRMLADNGRFVTATTIATPAGQSPEPGHPNTTDRLCRRRRRVLDACSLGGPSSASRPAGPSRNCAAVAARALARSDQHHSCDSR